MKIHCAQLVESALRSALEPAPAVQPVVAESAPQPTSAPRSPTLRDSFKPTVEPGRTVRMVFKSPTKTE